MAILLMGQIYNLNYFGDGVSTSVKVDVGDDIQKMVGIGANKTPVGFATLTAAAGTTISFSGTVMTVTFSSAPVNAQQYNLSLYFKFEAE